MVDFFCDGARASLEFRDKYLNEEHKVRTVLGEALTQHHPKLTRLILANCALTDDSIDSLMQGLINAPLSGGHQLQHLDLSQNDFSQHAVGMLCNYLKHENGWKLRALVLDRNNIYDGGLQLLASGLFERYQIFEGANRSGQVSLPIQYLGLSDTKFTDNGFKTLMQRFEAIYLRNL